MDTQAGTAHALPVMDPSAYATMGQSVPAWTYFENFALKANVFHVRGTHTFRAGIDARDHRRDDGAFGNPNGLFNFTNALTRREEDCLTAGARNLGLSWAAFTMGLPANSNVATNATYAFNNPYLGWHGQDTWLVTPKLTLTLGLRMEYEFGMKERYNRYDVGFNPAAMLPITALAEAAYAQNPVPELSPSAFSVWAVPFMWARTNWARDIPRAS